MPRLRASRSFRPTLLLHATPPILRERALHSVTPHRRVVRAIALAPEHEMEVVVVVTMAKARLVEEIVAVVTMAEAQLVEELVVVATMPKKLLGEEVVVVATTAEELLVEETAIGWVLLRVFVTTGPRQACLTVKTRTASRHTLRQTITILQPEATMIHQTLTTTRRRQKLLSMLCRGLLRACD